MKIRVSIMLALLLLPLGVLFAGNSAGNVAVLYHGNTQVNREALHFMGQQFNAHGSPYNFSAVGRGADISPDVYDLILVLNTGRSSGIDPVLAGFIDSWQDKSRIILISLRRGSRDYVVESLSASANPAGVDAVSAASRWEGGGFFSSFGGRSDNYQMHLDWTGKVIELIDQKM